MSIYVPYLSVSLVGSLYIIHLIRLFGCPPDEWPTQSHMRVTDLVTGRPCTTSTAASVEPFGAVQRRPSGPEAGHRLIWVRGQDAGTRHIWICWVRTSAPFSFLHVSLPIQGSPLHYAHAGRLESAGSRCTRAAVEKTTNGDAEKRPSEPEPRPRWSWSWSWKERGIPGQATTAYQA